ncbi:transporter substrate-binding domain-containing protein [Fluviispira multicolorata]|uniref:Transporter substrate-binding domain-containing protein n=1 Tax=Fluviispira multicolorata TaxID=2654512 RepID=A0A833JBZ2_9BACT|nr:transporter substrate-binding domain-containing protein [Fluviispira multicolorata]KAB8029843.1 transporter substrate-binding domain-containing protein [Fluviispira multicolorata]
MLDNKFLYFLFISVFFKISFIASGEESSKTKVTILNYNNTAPWNTNKENTQGLNVELANFLNQDKKSPYFFVTEFAPRKRVDYLITQLKEMYVVAWVNQKFFPSDLSKSFLWTESIINDYQLVISNKNNIIDYKNIESLFGKKFSAVFGTKYISLEPYINSGKIIRVDSYRFNEALQRVIGNQPSLDFFIAENSFIKYDKAKNLNIFAPKKVHISLLPFSPIYGRSLMVSKLNMKLFSYLNEKILSINNNSEWKNILKKYGQATK